MCIIRAKLGSSGRVVIPAQYRKALGLKPGDEVILALENGEVRIFSRREAIKRAQSLVRQYIPADRNLADELIQDRRKEASRE